MADYYLNHTASEIDAILTKVDGVEAGANVNVQVDWNQTTTTADDYIKNKPTIPDAQIQSDWNQTDTDSKDFIKNKPTIPAAQVNSDWTASSGVTEILNKPSLGAAAAKNVDSAPTDSSENLVESGGVYEALSGKVNTSDLANTVVTLKLGSNISSESDLNDFTTLGNYYCTAVDASTLSNAPLTNVGFRLIVKVEMITEVKLEQIFNPERSYKEYKRYYVNGNWSAWKMVQNDLDSYATVSYVDGLVGNINTVLEEVL